MPEAGTRIYASAGPSVALIESIGTLYNGEMEVARGTGFVIGDEGKILTNSHVVPVATNYKKLEITARLGSINAVPEPIQVTSRDANQDLVLLQLQSKRQAPKLSLLKQEGHLNGMNIFVIGFPLTYDLSIVDGLLSNTNAKPGRWQTQAPLNPGNSGGPVFDSSGNVIAIAVGGVPKATIEGHGEIDVDGISWVIPIEVACNGLLVDIANEILFSQPGITSELPITINRSYQVAETKDDHPVFLAPHSRDYMLTFKAEPGYKIIEASFSATSDSKFGSDSINILEGGIKVEFKFKLRSGPAVDRWRGWVTGTLQTTQVRQ